MAKKVTVFNKGSRSFAIGKKGEEVVVAPKKAAELDKELADKLLKLYPHDIIQGGVAPSAGVVEKLKEELAAVKAELAEAKAELAKKDK